MNNFNKLLETEYDLRTKIRNYGHENCTIKELCKNSNAYFKFLFPDFNSIEIKDDIYDCKEIKQEVYNTDIYQNNKVKIENNVIKKVIGYLQIKKETFNDIYNINQNEKVENNDQLSDYNCNELNTTGESDQMGDIQMRNNNNNIEKKAINKTLLKSDTNIVTTPNENDNKFCKGDIVFINIDDENKL